MAATSQSRSAPAPASLARRSLRFVAPHRFAATGIVLLALVLAALGAADPLVMKWLFDALSGGTARTALLPALAALLALELGRALLNARLQAKTWDVRIAVDYGLRAALIDKLQALPLSYHESRGVGGIMNRINQGVTGFVDAFGQIAFNVIPTLVYLVLSVWAMVRMEWHLALVVIAFTPLPALVGAWAAKEQTRRERMLLDRWTRIYSRLNEVLAGIRTVKIFGREDEERERFLSAQHEGNEIVRRGVRRDAKTGALRSLFAAMARLAAIGGGGYLVVRGQITVGTLVAFLGYVSGLFGPVQGLTDIYQTVQKANVALETIFEILDTEDIAPDLPDCTELERVRGEIRFHDVHFTHADGTDVLKGVELAVRPGETLALVGPSGSGKSTLITLLQRLYLPTRGQITVDGRDVRGVSKRSLREQFAVVSQDIHVFNDTIRANIGYGRLGATDEEIEVAARLAQAHDFIMSLPDGYDTMVGERGSRLSGGQRQRLAIARALLRDAPILLLDEATSALDTVVEGLVQEALETLQQGRTTMVIAHRMSTVVNADRIAVLEEGRIVAIGGHEELLASSEQYAALVGELAEREERRGLVAVA